MRAFVLREAIDLTDDEQFARRYPPHEPNMESAAPYCAEFIVGAVEFFDEIRDRL